MPVASSLYKVQRRLDWSRVFARNHGWTGSDNTYSIPAPGTDWTFFTFGDSFVGNVDLETHERSANSVMINNALGILRGKEPQSDRLEIRMGDGYGKFQATSFVSPKGETPGDEARVSESIISLDQSTYYWLQDGFVDNNKLYIFASRVCPDPNGPEGFKFKVTGTDLLGWTLHETETLELKDLAVYPIPFDIREESSSLYFGAAVYYDDPEWLYIYGLYQEQGAHLVLARVPKGQILNWSNWEFYSSGGWSSNLRKISIIADQISSECSVQPLNFGPDKGKYALIYNRSGIEPYVEMRLSDSLEGPFGSPEVIWVCPEADEKRGIYCYNAKAHTELSEPGSLLISYNVNTRSDAEHMRDARIYRTRWIELRAAPLKLHPLLKDGAVLQRDQWLTLPGRTQPGALVKLGIGESTFEALADTHGNFSVTVPPQSMDGPKELRWTVGDEEYIVKDVLWGDVYLAGGQSNMQLPFADSAYADVNRDLFNDDLLRVCMVPQRDHWTPRAVTEEWNCEPWCSLKGETLDGFSAVASYAGLALRQMNSEVPIGIVGSYMGATSATCWMSQQSFEKAPDLSIYQENFMQRVHYWESKGDWEGENQRFQEKAAIWEEKANAYLRENPNAIEVDLTKAIGPGAWPPPEDRNSFMRPSGLYETMIEPLAGWRFRGIWFYQGESDVEHAKLYDLAFTTMLNDWRQLFGEIPFVQVQLPAYAADATQKDDRSWGYLREQQRRMSRRHTLVDHIVALDQGQLGDLHPKKKDVLGQRLASMSIGQFRDAYVQSVHVENRQVIVAVDLPFNSKLLYVPGSIGDERDRANVTDSGFDVRINGTWSAIPKEMVYIVDNSVYLSMDDLPPGDVQEVAYGYRNRAIPTCAVTSEGCEDLSWGTLEAFCVPVLESVYEAL